jgi:hypothetical protein
MKIVVSMKMQVSMKVVVSMKMQVVSMKMV